MLKLRQKHSIPWRGSWAVPNSLILSMPSQLLSLQVITYSSCQPQVWLILSDSKFHEVQVTCVLKAPLLINLEKLNYFGFTAQRKRKITHWKMTPIRTCNFFQLRWSFFKSYAHSSSEFLFLLLFPSSGFSHILFLTLTHCLLILQKCSGSLHLLP